MQHPRLAAVATLDPTLGAMDELALQRLAARQNGVGSLAQFAALGLGRRGVSSRVPGRLVRTHRGAYAVGQARLATQGRWMAAVLASGPDAAVSRRDAAAARGLRFGALRACGRRHAAPDARRTGPA